ncbi:Protein of unknown function DUF543 [Phytophthora cactorum]|nr:Protein of unknown function DUF543 [Phytophthora cactorum]
MSDNKEIPSEYRISEKWDKCLENFTLYFGAGLVAGGLSSLVLARMFWSWSRTGHGSRRWCGRWSSWTTCQLAFAGNTNAQAALDKTDKAVGDFKEKISGSN